LARLASEQRREAERHGAAVLALGTEGYPTRLTPGLAGFLPPPILYVLGDPSLLGDDGMRIGVIGARACTPYGRGQAARFGEALARAGVTVVSGAARGIDQAAMAAAHEAEGRVVAVLGSPLDRLYPADAVGLLSGILESGGAILSEFAFGSGTRPGNFPRRNRVLAAVSDALLVVQAGRHSGTMSTCEHALALGREVCSLPGDVDCPVSAGTHRLIQDGCALVTTPDELLHQLRRTHPPEAFGQEDPLLVALAAGDAGTPQLAARLGEDEAVLRMRLVDLELRGLVRRLPGGDYHRCGSR
jgi:DNA processing protein